jgi:hypothetical protein
MKRNYLAPTPPIAVVVNGSSSWLVFEENWQSTVRNSCFPFIIWLRQPPRELYDIAQSKIKLYPDAREEWLCPKPDWLV